MERRKLTQIKTKGPSFWKCLFACIRSSSDDNKYVKKEKTSDILAAKHSVSVTYTASSYYLMHPNKIISDNRSLNDALSLVYSEKLKNCCMDQKSNTAIPAFTGVNREETDKLVKSALTKYLAQKRNENLEQQKSEPPPQVKKRDKEKKLQSDFLSVVTVDSSETIKLVNEEEDASSLKLKVEFPTKSRSAPTNSSAHDSLADICSKMSRYKQENNKSDSYVTCCSQQNSKESTNTKKKLELIFNKSSDDTLPFFDGRSNLSLSYKINCEVASSAEETSKTDSEWLDDDDRVYEFLRKKRKRLPNQELYLHPTAKEKFGGYSNSTSSLKWKLIISHHGHGDIDRYY